MTLVELVLYIAIFATLFAGFVNYTFEFSRTIASYSKNEDSERVGAIAEEFVRWYVHRSEQLVMPAVTDVERLFRFDSYIKLEGVHFLPELCGADAQHMYSCVAVYFYLKKAGTASSTELFRREVPLL